MKNQILTPVVYNLFTTEEELKSKSETKVAVVVFVCEPERKPIVYDISGVDDVDNYISRLVSEITSGCAYVYEFVKKIDNVYFYK